MKKGWLIAWMLAVALVLTGCGNFQSETEIEGSTIPEQVSHIEFWNGGTLIGEYNNCRVHLIISNAKHVETSLVKENIHITFYKYEIKEPGKDPEYIIDSEALAIKFRE